MNNKLIRLTEGDLHRIVKESTKKILTETEYAKGEQIVDDFSKKIEEEIKRFGCKGKISVKYEPYIFAYEFIAEINDDSAWAIFLFVMLRNNLNVVSWGQIHQSHGYIWFKKE